MIADLLEERRFLDPVALALRSVPQLPEREAGESRVVLCGLTWEQYEAVDDALGNDRAEPRLYYLEGELEIMTTSFKHEHLKKWLATLLEDYLFELGIETFPHGQATLIQRIKEAGAEPDESWCFGENQEWPHLVMEVIITSGGVQKLEIYRRFGIREVWFWRKGIMEVWKLNADGSAYEGPGSTSALLPGLNIPFLLQCVELPTWLEARRIFRQSLVSRGLD